MFYSTCTDRSFIHNCISYVDSNSAVKTVQLMFAKKISEVIKPQTSDIKLRSEKKTSTVIRAQTRLFYLGYISFHLGNLCSIWVVF